MAALLLPALLAGACALALGLALRLRALHRQRDAAAAQAAEAELRFRSIFDNAVLGMYQTTEDGHYLAANQALADLYGYPTPAALMAGLSDIAGRLYVERGRRDDFKALIRARARVVDFESEVYRRDGERIWISENAHAVHGADGRFLYYEGSVEDISERRRHRTLLEHQATHDPVTGLPNRYLLQDRLDRAMGAARRRDERLMVAFIDLDNFKFVNDSMGHAVGDRLLVEMARRLQACVRETDTLARYGGDEFVLIISSAAAQAGPVQVLERVHDAVRQPLALEGRDLSVGCSMGVAVYPRDGADLETLLRHADAAMYQAKAAGKGQFRFYEAGLNAAVQERLALESALRRTLENDSDEFQVAYQPKFDASGDVCGCEALARWHSTESGTVAPDRFIPLAEETGLIVLLTARVLHAACAEAVRWSGQGGAAPGVAVNISARHFRRDGQLAALVRAALEQSGLPPGRLQLELTESLFVGNVEETVAILGELKALGVTIAIDDFGTGYSSLAYLKRFPVDVLKIDRSFVGECDRADDARSITGAVLSLGRSLGLRVVAEGVERPAQAAYLLAHGCDELQGYLYAQPMPAAALRDFLASYRGGRRAPALAAVG
ncbi:putative bifunctional diguanylate cyclase/phosphodiesterase [Azoarcus olearius]|uniref:GGEF/EAL/PAS/PAC-domain containing protein n=1 Tax=Azoarcus sp. (strain BH72) TaxID=418699 RepID=A1K412_AZOSB|nr:EAL domain-containing protein [Azoarcus olearius]CAL93567.1 GGEF/EAL/PAS/PAC-domain containing protein [Azoarcus olearius]